MHFKKIVFLRALVTLCCMDISNGTAILQLWRTEATDIAKKIETLESHTRYQSKLLYDRILLLSAEL